MPVEARVLSLSETSVCRWRREPLRLPFSLILYLACGCLLARYLPCCRRHGLSGRKVRPRHPLAAGLTWWDAIVRIVVEPVVQQVFCTHESGHGSLRSSVGRELIRNELSSECRITSSAWLGSMPQLSASRHAKKPVWNTIHQDGNAEDEEGVGKHGTVKLDGYDLAPNSSTTRQEPAKKKYCAR